ncbi:hypothetical protein D7V90_23775 [bacterium 1xD42-87]|nr:hypothetical protein D7V90_23775 [bacterium 1xD42-87]
MRLICTCGHTHAILPDFIIPYSGYGSFIGKSYFFGKETLFPVVQEAADDIAAVTLIDGRIPVQEAFPALFCFVSGNDFSLFIHGNL